MNISVKESLEHVCDVFHFFGIDYITAEVLRRGKNEKKLNRRKAVIIKLNLLLNDLCLLYCFEFKRRFKPNYSDYIKKELPKLEERYVDNGRSSNRKKQKNVTQEREHGQGYGEDCEGNTENGTDDGGEDCYQEELDEDVNYFEELHIVSPLVILLLEQFEYPRLYHLLKCNFQMAKELLLCIGFLIDATKMFEHFDRQQPFYDVLFNVSDNTSKPVTRKSVAPNVEKGEDCGFQYFINEAMLFLSNRPYDIEIFECKHFHRFLEKWKNNFEEGTSSSFSFSADPGGRAKVVTKKKEKDEEELLKNVKTKEENEDEMFSLEEFVNYDYSKYQENFLNYYNKRRREEEIYYHRTQEECEHEEEGEDDHEYRNDGERGSDDDSGEHVYAMEIMKNINKNCSQLLQLEKKVFLSVNQLQNFDNNRLMLFHRFNELISRYTEPHTITVNWNSGSSMENYKSDRLLNKTSSKGKKVNLNDNVLFTVSVEDSEKEHIENQKVRQRLSSGIMNPKGKATQQSSTNSSNNNSSYRSTFLNKGKNTSADDNEFLNDINEEFLNDRININEYYILNNIPLYNKIIHIYKNGLDFFQYEKLRAVFWIWLQSLFPETLVEGDGDVNEKEKTKENVTFNDINNNMFFFDNVGQTKEEEWLHLHVLNDLNDFEKNYKMLKEYLKSKGCTVGYNKITGSEKHASHSMSKFESITKYVHNLHLEFEAFFNYKKKSKSLSEEIFVEFLDDKKKHMVVNSNVEKDDYTNLANVVHKHLININNIKYYNPILNISHLVEGIRKQNFIKTDTDINKMEIEDWKTLYAYHQKQKDISGSGKQSKDFSKRYIINLTNHSNYNIYQKPVTYASSIFQYADQFITNNDIYSFSENIFKINEEFEDLVKTKHMKCTHNFFHILDKVEKYMDCVAFNL